MAPVLRQWLLCAVLVSLATSAHPLQPRDGQHVLADELLPPPILSVEHRTMQGALACKGSSREGPGSGGAEHIQVGSSTMPCHHLLVHQARTIAELVAGAGFPLEEHFVETKDGYVLGIYRIPHGRGESTAAAAAGQPKPPVLLQVCRGWPARPQGACCRQQLPKDIA